MHYEIATIVVCMVKIAVGGQKVLSFDCSVSIECPGGFQSPCNGRGRCLDGFYNNGTCNCQVEISLIVQVVLPFTRVIIYRNCKLEISTALKK